MAAPLLLALAGSTIRERTADGKEAFIGPRHSSSPSRQLLDLTRAVAPVSSNAEASGFLVGAQGEPGRTEPAGPSNPPWRYLLS